MTSKIGNFARRRLESEPGFPVPKQLNFSKLSDAGRLRGNGKPTQQKTNF
jgi:hypothetical protein